MSCQFQVLSQDRMVGRERGGSARGLVDCPHDPPPFDLYPGSRVDLRVSSLVLPAASSPSMRMRISLLPKILPVPGRRFECSGGRGGWHQGRRGPAKGRHSESYGGCERQLECMVAVARQGSVPSAFERLAPLDTNARTLRSALGRGGGDAEERGLTWWAGWLRRPLQRGRAREGAVWREQPLADGAPRRQATRRTAHAPNTPLPWPARLAREQVLQPNGICARA